jgi:NADH dehydrogenase
MHVLLTGATGFVGSYVLRALTERGHTVRCLMRSPDQPLAAKGDAVERAAGDVTDFTSLPDAMRGCDAVVHLVGIIEEKPRQGVTFERIHNQGTRHMVDAAREAGIERFVLMSANGARPDGVSAYQTTKWKAEEYVRDANFEHWTIFRPSIIFGDPGTRAESFEVRLARTIVGPFPVWPVFGDGRYRIQPVHVEAVAEAFGQAVGSETANGETYCPAGKERITYNEALDRIARGLGTRPAPKLHLPLPLVRPLVLAAGKLGLLPISPDQFKMLLDGNTCDPSAFYRDFEVRSLPFEAESMAYLPSRS